MNSYEFNMLQNEVQKSLCHNPASKAVAPSSRRRFVGLPRVRHKTCCEMPRGDGRVSWKWLGIRMFITKTHHMIFTNHMGKHPSASLNTGKYEMNPGSKGGTQTHNSLRGGWRKRHRWSWVWKSNSITDRNLSIWRNLLQKVHSSDFPSVTTFLMIEIFAPSNSHLLNLLYSPHTPEGYMWNLTLWGQFGRIHFFFLRAGHTDFLLTWSNFTHTWWNGDEFKSCDSLLCCLRWMWLNQNLHGSFSAWAGWSVVKPWHNPTSSLYVEAWQNVSQEL